MIRYVLSFRDSARLVIWPTIGLVGGMWLGPQRMGFSGRLGFTLGVLSLALIQGVALAIWRWRGRFTDHVITEEQQP